jgi:putative ABC transport system permease protein
VIRFERSARALFAAVLHLYPAAYRDEYGKEMTLVLVDRLRGEVGAARLSAVLGAIAAVVMDAPRQHMHVLVRDLRLAARVISREKWFATVAIGTVAIGIGLSTAVFSVGKSLLVDAIPYGEAERATMVWVRNPRQDVERDFTSYPRLLDWRRNSRLIDTFAGYAFRQPVLTGAGEAEQLRVVRATPDLFEVVRAEPLAGRLFAATEEQAAIVLISHGLWQRRFGGQWTAVGQTLRLDSAPYTIIGVLPAWFHFPERGVDAWVPLQPTAQERQARRGFWLRTVGRLKPGVSLAQAQEEMNAIASGLGREHPEDRELGVALVGLHEEIARPFKPALVMLSAAVLGVLLIACVNVAGMLTARGAARRREVAIRTALGASRRRVLRQLLTEAVVLFLLGGVLGVCLGWIVLRSLVQIAPPALVWLRDASLDGPMLGIELGMAALTGLFFGVVPSWKAAGADAVEVVASGVKGAARTGVSQRFRRVLVISQIAIATVVASFATLMVTSLINAQRVELGFDARGVLTAEVQLPRNRYREPATRQQFFDRLLDRVRELPGVRGAAAGSSILLNRMPNSSAFTVEGRSEIVRQPLTFDIVTPDFFRVLQIPLLRGRYFSNSDTADSLPVVIINETAARTHWPNDNPLGKRFKFGDPDDDVPWLTVVGVVADTRRAGVDYRPLTESYQPYTQDPRSMTVLARTEQDPMQLTTALRTAVRDLDTELAVANEASLDTLIDAQVAPRRFNTWLLTAFGAAAIALTAIGLYSLLAYLVTLRRHEMAVRLSMGATPYHVLGLIVRHISVVVGIGATVGLVGAFTTATSMRGLLFGITPWDPLSQVFTLGLLAIVAIAAAWIPVRRAMRVDPAAVLRNE